MKNKNNCLLLMLSFCVNVNRCNFWFKKYSIKC